MQEITNNNFNPDNIEYFDKQGLELFDQIEISNQQIMQLIDIKNQSFDYCISNGKEQKRRGGKKKLKKLKSTLKQIQKHIQFMNNQQLGEIQNNLSLIKQDKDHISKNKRRRKQKKKLKRIKKLNKIKLSKINQQFNNSDAGNINNKQKQIQSNNNQQWSGQSQKSLHEDSDDSYESMLEQLNPHKLKKKNIKKQHLIQQKQGFSLKQLGNDAEMQYDNEQQESDEDQSYANKKKKSAKKPEKKQVPKNQSILRQLIDIGLCQQQQNEQQNRQGYECDTGFDQVISLKTSKKKIPKITNRLFTDMQIKQQQQNTQPSYKSIQLQVKQRINNGLSIRTSSFLNKAQQIKKIRGMQSQIHNQQYQKLLHNKNKQVITKLLNKKQIQQAQQIQLNIKIPQIIKNKIDLNHTLFQNKYIIDPINNQQHKKNYYHLNQLKISRLDLFKQIIHQVKIRKSKDITHQIIKNSFKITQLQQIEQMRKKYQQKRRKQALKGSDDQSDEQSKPSSQNLKKVPSSNEPQQIKQNNFKFLNSKIQTQQNNKQLNNRMSTNKQPQQNCAKQKKANHQIQNPLSTKQYLRLLQLQEGAQQKQNQNAQQMQIQLNDDEQQDEEEVQQRDLNKMEMEFNEGEESEQQQYNYEKQLKPKHLQKAQKVQLYVDIQVSNNVHPQQQQQQQQSSFEYQQLQDNNQQYPQNNQYQQYLNELQEQGIKIKKNNLITITDQNINNQIFKVISKQTQLITKKNQEKQNQQRIQNSQYPKQHYHHNQQQSIVQNHVKASNNIILDNPPNYDETRKQFRKLRKFATIIKHKKNTLLRTKKAGQYYQQQAEEGSDNEQHDDKIKQINDDEQAKLYNGFDLDADLEELIDNAVDINQEDEELAFKKYMEDVKIQDRQQLRRIMKGDFKRRNNNQNMIEDMEEDEKLRLKRMEEFEQYMKKKQAEDGKDLYINEQKVSNQINQQQQQDANDEDESDKKKDKNKDEVEVIQQQVEQMNEQNLKRYLDECLLQSFRQTKIIKTTKSLTQLPQSYKRTKKTEMRNTMKIKQFSEDPIKMFKIKKNSSHLNQMIMKNKQKIKNNNFKKNFMGFQIGKK